MLGKKCLLPFGLLVWVWVAQPLRGQVPLTAAESERVERFLDSDFFLPPLRCSIQPQKPFLDFASRFLVGYILSCPLRVFEGRATEVMAFTRVTPEGRQPLTLGQSYRVAGLSPEQAAVTNIRKLKGRIEASGGFCIGEGRYQVEVLLVDRETGRTKSCRFVALVGEGAVREPPPRLA